MSRYLDAAYTEVVAALNEAKKSINVLDMGYENESQSIKRAVPQTVAVAIEDTHSKLNTIKKHLEQAIKDLEDLNKERH